MKIKESAEEKSPTVCRVNWLNTGKEKSKMKNILLTLYFSLFMNNNTIDKKMNIPKQGPANLYISESSIIWSRGYNKIWKPGA